MPAKLKIKKNSASVKIKIKKNDSVKVLVGSDKGRQGKVLKIYPRQNKVLVEGVNKKTKHIKPNPNKNQPGSITQKEAWLDISNVAILNTVTNKPDKIKTIVTSEGKKQRHFKSTDEIIDI